MAEEVQGEEVVVEEGTTAEGVQEEEVVTLPSDTPEFVMPEKFQGKSAEEIARSYIELEKMKGGDVKSQEEKGEESKEETTPEETSKEDEQYQKYVESFEKNGGLSEAEYAELDKAGYDKATVDAEIKRRQELKEFESWRQEKALNEVLEPLGGGTEKFKEVAEWANKTKDKAEVEAFNAALAAAPKLAQQALLKQLYTEYEAADKPDVLHTNSPQSTPSKGYSSEADFFKDISSPEYTSHKTFAKAVEAKLAKTDTTGWSIG